MRMTVLGGIALMCAATASAQTSGAATSQPNAQTTASSKAAQTVTMTGCVGAASGSQGGFILANPVVVPSSAQPGTPTAGIASPSSSPTPGTQPPAGSVAGATGTAGTGATAGSAASAGVGAAGTGAASMNAMNGYRLSGNDMSSWAGQRVQIVGVVMPAATRGNGSAAPGGTGATGQTLPEFRVQSVQPVTGNCPQR